MNDIFSLLAKDHSDVKSIVDRLEATAMPTPEVAGAEAIDARGKLAETLVIEESKHEAAEEQYFWPAVREHLDDGDRLADTAIEQESEGKRVLDQLRKAQPGSADFERLVAEFIKAGREHIAFEEHQVWPRLRAALSSEDSAELAEKYEKAKESGPTRPHPNTPASPGVLKTAGAAAAMVDRATDAITGRGKES